MLCKLGPEKFFVHKCFMGYWIKFLAFCWYGTRVILVSTIQLFLKVLKLICLSHLSELYWEILRAKATEEFLE